VDISDAILARSDQLNAIDLLEPVIVTVVEVRAGNAEQPVHIVTDRYGKERPFKPSKTVLRDLGKAWGKEAQAWVGRRMELYNEPTVLWAGKPVGGIRVSGLSHIPGPIKTAHTIARGKYQEVTIRALPDDDGAVVDALADINSATSLAALKAAWDLAGTRGVQKHPDVITATNKRKAELS
jgi:hypothetical protein